MPMHRGNATRNTTTEAIKSLGPAYEAALLGVPLAIKDSYQTKGPTTTFNTSVLAAFEPTRMLSRLRV